jgi:tetratricopeptide (TPR) repeat protein
VSRCGVLLLFICLAPAAAGAQASEGSLEWFDAQAKEAISQSNYESAVKILTEAKEKFPKTPKINLELADLYYDKDLYALALEEYGQAEKKGSEDFHTLNQISRCFGKLGKDRESIGYLTKILSLYPDSVETMDDLGWMYFKTYQLEKGEKILLDGIKKFGMQRNMAMTLGTIYSGMNSYDKAREYYLKSIDDALRAGDRYFASIAYYNLSLLEENFYHFNSSLAFTEESISMEDRASGHLARGELLESRLDYRGAVDEYMKAYALDTTPLTKVNLAILYQRFGRLELARRYAEEALSVKDMAWILYYGTDLSRHYKDIHEILADIYDGLARTEATRPTSGLFDRIAALATSLWDRIVSWYHRQRFLLYSLAIGRQYMIEGRREESYWEFYKVNQRYPEVAVSYLGKAKILETARTPHAGTYYLQEEGMISGSVDLLERSIEGFDPFWEKEAIANSLRALIPLLGGKERAAARRGVLDRLFEINPGAFRQDGLGLPLRLEIAENSWGKREKARIVRYLKRAGSEIVESAPGGRDAPGAEGIEYSLSLRLEQGGKARFTVADIRSGRVVASGSRELSGSAAARCAAFVQGILDELYKVE